MTPVWSPASIRVRLTGWYAIVLALMLVVYAAVTFTAVRYEFVEQLDAQLHDEFETAEGFLAPTPAGGIVWSDEQHRDPGDEEDRSTDVWAADGRQIARSGASAALPPVAAGATSAEARYQSIVANDRRWRTLTGAALVGGRSVVLRVARSEERLRAQLREVLIVLVLGLPMVVALSGIGGYLLAGRALEPMESSFEQLRRFTADASHELRTPLSVIRGIGEVSLAETRSPAEYKAVMGSMLEEVDRLSTLVDTLLRLSHADAGTVRLAKQPVDLGQLSRDVVSSLGILAEERGQRIDLKVDEKVTVEVDRLVLREAITNILDNAIKYSGRASVIRIAVRPDGSHALLTVTDTGPGIAAEHRERIFDRFFRLDEARSRDNGGTGLGLAIAKWAVEVNGGRISVAAAAGGGSVFSIELPMSTIMNHQEKTT